MFAPIWKSPRSGSCIHGSLPVFSSQDGCDKVWRGIGVHETDFESMRLLEGSELCASNCRYVGSCICNNRVKNSIYISTTVSQNRRVQRHSTCSLRTWHYLFQLS